MAVLEQGQIQIHTENIFPIIKKAVYSGHEVFLRELVSNGLDAINKRRLAAMAGDCDEGAEGVIRIRIDREAKTLTISDNGIGMTADEVRRYINQVAFSSAEEFLEKYKHEGDAIIGHFGLGFYSSFMVAARVDLISRSACPGAAAVRWSCDGSPSFSLEEGAREEAGTDVVLHLQEEELEYLEPARIRQLVNTYCDFMPVAVELEGETLNRRIAPWRSSPRELKDEDYLELYRYLYPMQADPLLWVHLNTDYPYSLQGILFFPKLSGRADWDQGQIRLYCNQVFVSDAVKEVVPRFLLPLKGVIDSADIPLNVSRSALQTDRRVRSIGGFIARKVGDRLVQLQRDEPSHYAEIWDDIAPFIKIGAMEEEKFADRVVDQVLFRTTASAAATPQAGSAAEDTAGVAEAAAETEAKAAASTGEDPISVDSGTYTTLRNYRQRAGSGNKRILYCSDESGQASALQLWKGQGAEVLLADAVVDAQFLPWLEQRHGDITFQRVDAELDGSLTDETPALKDAAGGEDSEKLRDVFRRAIDDDKVTVRVQALKGDEAPAALILLPEQMRRMNDLGALMQQQMPGLPDHHVLVVNRRHPLVKGLLRLAEGAVLTSSGGNSPSAVLSADICRHLHELARMGVGGLTPERLPHFQRRSMDLMGRLMEHAI